VLIVEDDAGVRQALERGLTSNGFDTTTVTSGAAALGIDDHDIALVDLGLPDRDGVELCTELRARHPERPIIVVTGRHDELDVVDALDAGADDYVTKPFRSPC
jgi:two-component system, OmpR family, response regulator RegX3